MYIHQLKVHTYFVTFISQFCDCLHHREVISLELNEFEKNNVCAPQHLTKTNPFHGPDNFEQVNKLIRGKLTIWCRRHGRALCHRILRNCSCVTFPTFCRPVSTQKLSGWKFFTISTKKNRKREAKRVH